MRVIGKILASIAALAFVMTTTAASAAPMMSVDSQLIKVADKKAEPKKAEAKKAEAKKVEKAAPKKAAKKKVVKKKVAKKAKAKAKKGKGKTCGVGMYKKGGKCLSAAEKK